MGSFTVKMLLLYKALRKARTEETGRQHSHPVSEQRVRLQAGRQEQVRLPPEGAETLHTLSRRVTLYQLTDLCQHVLETCQYCITVMRHVMLAHKQSQH